AELDEEEALELLQTVGQEEPGLATLARAGFHTLGLQTYLTAGPKESRAWTIKKGATAPEAAGVIHTDFQKGFIKAEVISYDDLVATGSVAEARFFLADRLEEFQRLFLVQLGEVRLQLGVEEDRVPRGDQGALLGLEVLVHQFVLVHVEDVEERLGRQQVQVVQRRRGLRALGDARGEEGAALLQDGLRLQYGLDLGLLVLLDPGLLLQPRQDPLDRLEVGEDQLGVDRLDVALRRDLAVDVDD
ncbi:DUF933 domain-containing protein, partial [Streptomyces daliensis]|nr:DUF933 domain-containing protein [Streptomyces daliensis]